MKYTFLKMQGCGNDFLVFDAMHLAPDFHFNSSEIQFLCDRHYGVGADGLVVLKGESQETAQARWEFFNCDGGRASMCGNAIRCAIRYLSDKLSPGSAKQSPRLHLETDVGVVEGHMLGEEGLVEVALLSGLDSFGELQEKVLQFPTGDIVRLTLLDVGVPHAVIEVENLYGYEITKWGQSLMYHPAFSEEGVNVTFFQRASSQNLRATTFERGVCEETLACGTGAVAAAIVFSQTYLSSFPLIVEMPGGSLEIDHDANLRQILLRGHTHYVMEVSLSDIPHDFIPRIPFEKMKSL